MKWIHAALAFCLVGVIPGLSQAGFWEYGWQVSGSVSGSASGPEQLSVPTGYGFAVSIAPNTPTMVSRVTLSDWSTPGSPYNQHFVVSAVITDASSGKKGTLSVDGQAFASTGVLDPPGGVQPTPALWGSTSAQIAGLSSTPATLTLGNNQYSMWIVPVNSTPGSTAPLIANVDVSVNSLGQTAATPEPGTLLLAAGGLPLVGLFFRRRR